MSDECWMRSAALNDVLAVDNWRDLSPSLSERTSADYSKTLPYPLSPHQVVPHKGQDISLFFYQFRDRFPGAVSGFTIDPDQDRVITSLVRLQGCGEFK